MNTTLEKLKERIKDKKYKLTTQRQTILQAFIDAEENHLSAEDVYVLVKEVKEKQIIREKLNVLINWIIK